MHPGPRPPGQKSPVSIGVRAATWVSLNGWRLGKRVDIHGGYCRGTGRYQLGSRRFRSPHVFCIAGKSHRPER
jgi:hypothetical protein